MKKATQGTAAAWVAWGMAAMAAAGAEWTGTTPSFRVDGRAGSVAVLEAEEAEWAVWDAAWTVGAERVEVTLERPGGSVETLADGADRAARGIAEWTPGEEEWGTFTLRHAALDGKGEVLEMLEARRARWRPEERAYGAWLGERGKTVEALPEDADADGDGASNWEEYVADTNPLDGREVFESRLVVGEGGVVRVEPSVVRTGRVYGVKVWRDLAGEPECRELGPGHDGIGAELNGEGEKIGFGCLSVSVPAALPPFPMIGTQF